MLQSRRCLLTLFAVTLATGACLASADEPQIPAKFYKLEFVVKEVNGSKVLNSRTYTTIITTLGKGEIRAGSKIPYASSGTTWQQIDVGVNIDVLSLKEVADKISFSIIAEVSSLADESRDTLRPTIRQNRWNSTVIIPLKKSTVLFSSENLDAKTEMQIEVTALPIP